MIHRALFGSLERFCGILIEHFAGRFPLWLSPVQAVITTITDSANDYAQRIKDIADSKGLRVETDLRNEKISYKIREHSAAKIPIIIIVGSSEASENTITIRRLGVKNQEQIELVEGLDRLAKEALSPLDRG